MVEDLKSSRILVVDDYEPNLLVLGSILQSIGYTDVVTLSDPFSVAPLCQAYDPHLLLLDLHMPGKNGLDVIAELRADRSARHLPILMLTADISSEAKVRALSTGANDFLTKPFDRTEVELRIRNLLEMRHLHVKLQNQNELLEERVVERTKQVETVKIEILDRLAMAAEFRDDQSGDHTRRVGRTSALIAATLGIPDVDVEAIRRAAPLHDVGKIGIPDAILLKPGTLTPAEREIMKRHTLIGAKLLSRSDWSTLQLAQTIAMHHHERWDGAGYGHELAGPKIPLPARVVAVADVFDALTHDRPYKAAWPVAKAVEEIRRERGGHFDPRVVDAFLAVHTQVDLVDSRETATELFG